MTPTLTPKNDLAFLATIKTPNALGKLVPLEDGVASVFLATSDASTATAADPTLVGSATYTGAGGKWLVRFESTALTPSLLAVLFTSTPPFVIIEHADGVRVAVPCAYSDVKRVEVEA